MCKVQAPVSDACTMGAAVCISYIQKLTGRYLQAPRTHPGNLEGTYEVYRSTDQMPRTVLTCYLPHTRSKVSGEVGVCTYVPDANARMRSDFPGSSAEPSLSLFLSPAHAVSGRRARPRPSVVRVIMTHGATRAWQHASTLQTCRSPFAPGGDGRSFLETMATPWLVQVTHMPLLSTCLGRGGSVETTSGDRQAASWWLG